MEYCILLSREDQKEAFKKIGLDGLFLRRSAMTKGRPFSFFPISGDTANQICTVYGGVQGDQYDSECETLEVQSVTASRLLAAALGIGAYNIRELRFLDDVNLLVMFQERAFVESRDVIYGGMVKNAKTGMYDVLFSTSASAVLAIERAREKAMMENKYFKEQGEEDVYNVDDIIIKQRTEVTVTSRGAWRRVPAEAEQAVRSFMEQHGRAMPGFGVPGASGKENEK